MSFVQTRKTCSNKRRYDTPAKAESALTTLYELAEAGEINPHIPTRWYVCPVIPKGGKAHCHLTSKRSVYA